MFVFLIAGAGLLAIPTRAQQPDTRRGGQQFRRNGQLRERLKALPSEKRRKIRRRLEREWILSSFSGFPTARRRKSESNLVMRAAAGLTGVSNSSTSIADVDGDGNLDLLITGFGANFNPTATLYLGDGQGGFTEAGAGLTGVSNSSTSIADVDGDQNKDLLITGEDANGNETSTLYLGDGQGGFTEAGAGLTGVSEGSTSIVDVDGDGNKDLLITGFDANGNRTATLYLGDGQGGFTEAGAGLTGVSSSSTSIADVDGDGNQDLLITGDAANGPSATLYLGDGQGSFSEAGAGLTGVSSSSISIADVDGDGNRDLLITGLDANLNPTATLYLGDGQGGFTEAGAGLAGFFLGSTSIADVNGDQNKDLLITGRDVFANPTATLYLGDEQGGFTEADAGLTGVSSSSTSIADLYGDGDPDLLITGFGALFSRPSTRIYVNRQNQSLQNRPPTFIRSFSWDRPLAPGVTLKRTIEAGDLDGDALSIQAPDNPNMSINDAGNGTAEVTFTPTREQGGNVVDMSVEASDSEGATGSFSTSAEVSAVVAAFPAGLAGSFRGSSSIGDVNEDGNLDILITGNAGTPTDMVPTATLYLGDGQGGFSEANADLTGVRLSAASIADVDGNGVQDPLIIGLDANGNPTATLYLGNGSGGFSEAGGGLTGVYQGATSIADVDGDGNPDLLITGQDENFDPTATLYLGDGQGGFSEAGAGLTGTQDGSTSIADVDGDGNPDLLITGQDESRDPTATLYLGDGQGGVSEAGAGLTGVSDGSTSIADVDGDGNQDLLITGEDANGNLTSTLYLGNGQGGFSEANADLTGVVVGATSIADVDGDGNQDLLITGKGPDSDGDGFRDPTATLYLGDGQGGFSEAGAGLTGTTDGSTSIADVDGDEDEDLLSTGLAPITRRDSPVTILYENLFNNPLPVELAGFEAQVDGKTVRLTWQTASETGNARFEVQRRVSERANGGEGTWTTVGSVDGAGTTSEAQSYRFVDKDLPFAVDVLTYRLRQVDTDGSAQFSKTVTVERGVTEVELLGTYPNPARSRATVRYALPKKQEVSLTLYDVLGREVRTVVRAEQSGRHERRVDVSGLPSGVYFLRLRAGGQTRTQKLTVVR
ncbi:MAG: FG-GAP-like repeat-containing protein [Salinibacter sp.]